jgi:hypothetical protein
MADIIEQLEATRPDYEKERRWHKLLLDAYSGGGGFQGAIKQATSSYWGPAAEIYSNAFYGVNRLVRDVSNYSAYSIVAGVSYLDRLPREDQQKYDARGDMSYYPNHIQGITDLKLSFLHSKEFQIENRPDELDSWRQDVNGKGLRYADLMMSVDLKAAICGWIPVLFDVPTVPGSITKAQAAELGIAPRMIPLLPANIIDYQLDSEGDFIWCKIRTDYLDRESPFSKASRISRYTIWYPDKFQIFEIEETDGKKTLINREEGGHQFGTVPLLTLPYSPCADDPIKGTPMHGQESLAARALFSRTSELDEHMMKQQAAALVYATNNPEQVGSLLVGPENGLTIPLDATQQHYYLAPPSSVSEVYRARNSDLVTEIYRMAGVDFLLNSQVPLSGISRRYQFMQLNADIAAFAQQKAKFEQRVDGMVGAMLGLDDEILEGIRITPPSNFDVEDIAEQIQNTSDILQLGLGPTADKAIRMRIVEHAIPNLSDEAKSQIEDELDQEAENQANDAALEQELNQNPNTQPQPDATPGTDA